MRFSRVHAVALALQSFILQSGCSEEGGDDGSGCPSGWLMCPSGCLNPEEAVTCPATGTGGSSAATGGVFGSSGGLATGGGSASGGGPVSSGGTGPEVGGSIIGSGGLSDGGGLGVGGSGGGDAGGAGSTESGGASASGGSGGGSSGGAGGSSGLPFLIGADITHTMEDEYWGATYTDGGQQKPLEVILKEHGFNAIRIDTFVDPTAPGGYADGLEQPFRGLEQTITLARRVKAQGLFFLLDLHMSDTWTNPGAQGTPAAWTGLSLAQLQTAVHDYVLDTVRELTEAGARPDLVQVGNEITNGMLWDSGAISQNDFSAFASLLQAGIAGVREADEEILVMLHIEKCNNLETTRWWLDGVLAEGVEFDVFGQSCYGPADHHPGYQGEPSEWQTTFDALASEYPDLRFAIAEYSAKQREANDVIFNLPDGRGIGTFNWDPTRFYETHPNVPLFDTNTAWNDFVAIPERMAIYEDMAADYRAAGR